MDGLDYNTQREKLKLMAYGRDIQQMVAACMMLASKEERQKAAQTIIDTMKRVVPSQQSYKEREPALWYHLALMSDFKLDIDYPVEIICEDKLAKKPEPVPYSGPLKGGRRYGRLLLGMFEELKSMPEGEERDALVEIVAAQMFRSLVAWGLGAADEEKVASDLARYTDGVIQVDPADLSFVAGEGGGAKKKKRNRKR